MTHTQYTDILYFWLHIRSLCYMLVIWSAEDRDREPNREKKREKEQESGKRGTGRQ